MKRRLLALSFLALLSACSSVPNEEDGSDDELAAGGRWTSPVTPGIYDLPNSDRTMYVGARLTTQLVKLAGRDLACEPGEIDVTSGTASVTVTDRNCEVNLTLTPSAADAIEARGEATIEVDTSKKIYRRERYEGVFARRPVNAVAGRYRGPDGHVLVVSHSDDTRLRLEVTAATAETTQGEAVSSDVNGLFLATMGTLFGRTPSMMFDLSVSSSCSGFVFVDRDQSGGFYVTTFRFEHPSCPDGLRGKYQKFVPSR